MNSYKQLPDYIYVARLKNIFWNNNSDLYPNKAPTIDLYTRIDKTRPTFITAYNGVIVLDGDFNHAIYNDKYYKLIKIKVLDIPKQKYEYQLEEDVIINLLNTGAEVRGILNRTNIPEILEDCLHTTQPVLETPAKLTVNVFREVKASWKETAKFIAHNPENILDILEPYVSNRDWYGIINRLKANIFIKTLQSGKKWNTEKRAGSQAHTINPAFIVDRLAPTYWFSWKVLVLGKIVEFTETWDDKKLSKISLISGSTITGKSCITYENATFAVGSAKEEQLELKDVDLSGLTDIVLVDDNGTPIDKTNPSSAYYRYPDKTKDLLPDGVGEGGTGEIQLGWYIKLCRNPHLPIKRKQQNTSPREKFLPVDSETAPAYRNYEEVNYTGQEPQEIILKDTAGQSGSKIGWLWYINRLDFAIVEGFGDKYKDNEMFEVFKYLSYIDDKKAKWADYYNFRRLDRQNIPGIGFLIYQIRKQPGLWDDYEYLGDNEPKQLEYISGLNTNLINYYSKKDEWWSSPTPNLLAINGMEELSKMTLDIDIFRWITFAPSAKGYLYKWTPNEYFGHYRYYQGRTPQYPSEFLNWDITINGRGRQNPLTKESIASYLTYRQNRIDYVTLRSSIELEKPIKQNDIFCSDLDYVWKQTAFYIKELPMEIDLAILEKINSWLPDVTGYTAASIPTTTATTLLKGTLHFKRYTALGQVIGVPQKNALGQAARGLLQALKSRAGAQKLAKPAHIVLKASKGVLPKLGKLSRIFGSPKHVGTALKIAKESAKNIKIATGGMRGLVQGARGALTAVRGALAIKTLGIAVATELLIWGLMKAYEQNTPDDDQRLQNSIWSMGDFFGGEEEDVSYLDNNLVVYLHKGEFKFGTFNRYQTIQNLSTDDDQIIETVNGTKSRQTTFTHIENLGGIDIKQTEPISKEREELLLRAAYRSFRGDEKIINITMEELEEPTNKILFDLVGTNWYAVFWKGKVHLVAKDTSSFVEKEHVNTREIAFQEGVKPSIYAQINQKSDLVVYSTTLPLNTKYTFQTEKERDLKHYLKITPMRKQLEALHDGGTDNLRDFWHVEYRTPYDYINTWVSVYQTKGVEIKKIEFGDYERIKLMGKQYDEAYWLGSQQNKNLLSDRKLLSVRQNEDIDAEFSRRKWDIARNAAVLGAKGLLYRGVLGGIKGAAFGGIASAIELWRYSREMPRLKERFTEDELNFMRDNHLAEYGRKQNYEYKKAENILNLNALTNTYIKPTSTDDDVERAFNKMNKWDDMHIKIYLPTPEQEEIIKNIYDEYGCYCRSDWFQRRPLIIKNNMEGGLYQFSNLEQTSIISSYTTDLQILEVVRNVLTNGTKFIEFKHEATQVETVRFIVPKGTELNFDTSTMEDWDDRIWDQYYVTKPKSEILKIIKNQRRFGLTQQEYEANKERLEGVSDDELLNNLNQIITNRQTGTVHILPPPVIDKVEAEKQILQGQITDLEVKIRDLQTDINNIQTEKTKLEAEIEARKLSSKLAADKTTDLERQLKECIRDKTNILQAKDTCDLINTQKIKELEKKLKDKESQIQIFNKQIDKATVDARVMEEECNKTLRRYLDEKDKLIADHKKELEAAKKAADQTELKEKIRQLTATAANECYLIKRFLDEPDSYDLKEENNGWSTFKALCAEVAMGIRWMRRADLDQRLSHYEEMKLLFQRLYELEQSVIMNKWMEFVNGYYWSDYVKWLEDPNSKGEYLESGKRTVTDITKLETRLNIQSLKRALDDLLWESYKAKTALEEQLKTDRDLQFMFAHAFPGDILGKYTLIFGDPNIAVVKKEFLTKFDCERPNISALKTLHVFDEQIKFNIDDIEKQPNKEPNTGKIWKNLYAQTDKITPVFLPAKWQPFWERDIPTTWDVRESLEARVFTQFGVCKIALYDDTGHKWLWVHFYGPRYYMRSHVPYKSEIPYYGNYADVICQSNYNGQYVRVQELTRNTDTLVYEGFSSNWGLDEINGARTALWRMRDLIQLPQEIEEAINKGTLEKTIRTRTYHPDTDVRFRYYDYKFNVVELFGKKHARNAVKLLAIIYLNKAWFESEGAVTGYENIDKFYIRSTFIYKYFTKKDHPKIFALMEAAIKRTEPYDVYSEFYSPRDFINLIWTVVINNRQEIPNLWKPPYTRKPLNDIIMGWQRQIQRLK